MPAEDARRSAIEAKHRPAQPNRENIQGTLDHITFQNQENGFTVARLLQKGGAEPVTVVGTLAGVPVGSTLLLTGSWTLDARFGRQFRVEQYQLIKPNTLAGIERYLGSGLIKGVGPGLAARIVETFGLATLDVLDQEPDRLLEVEGLGGKRLETIKQAWQAQRHIHQIMIFLQGHGISATYAVKIYKTYGSAAMEVVENNPFRLAEEIWGIGFKTADRIAASVGIVGNDPRRARAGLLYLLNTASEEGHCYLPEGELIRRGQELLGLSAEALTGQLPALVEDALLVATGGGIYLSALLQAERGVADAIKRLLAFPVKTNKVKDLDGLLTAGEHRMGIRFASEQRAAIGMALANKVSLVTGGPGTGKSTILRVLADILARYNLSLLQAAPTGRAAKRLAEATGREAKTIHRLLEFDPASFGFRYNSHNRLDAAYIVIDEVSMMDVVLANSLLQAVPETACVVLVGDADQLPSVGPGNVFADLLACGRLPTVRLNRIHRQGEGSLISLNASRINQGLDLELAPDYKGEKDFYCIFRDSPEMIEEEIIGLVATRLPKRYGFDPKQEIQVLTPMRRGVIGTDHLNRRLQAVLSPDDSASLSGYRPGDKVMQIKNNYEKEVFNGDIGFVRAVQIDNALLEVSFDGRTLCYESSELNELMLAYAITIHKSQGSEFPCAIMPLHTTHYPMLQRNLLYTCVTRGKKLMVLVGSRKAIHIAISNNSVTGRYTDLRERLSQE